MFVNALVRPWPGTPTSLAPEAPGTPYPSKLAAAKRLIERWQTKAFYTACLHALGVQTAYQIEQRLLDGENLDFPFDRPRLFDRMGKFGEPAVHKYMLPVSRSRRSTAYWIRKAMRLAPEIRFVALEPIWRLLAPQPVDGLLYQGLACNHARASATVDFSVRSWRIEVPRPDGSYSVCFVPAGLEGSRLGLERVLLQMRRAEAHQDFEAYYLSFLEVRARLSGPVDSSLLFMQAECDRHLVDCMSRVHINDKAATPIQESGGLVEAQEAFSRAKQAGKTTHECPAQLWPNYPSLEGWRIPSTPLE